MNQEGQISITKHSTANREGIPFLALTRSPGKFGGGKFGGDKFWNIQFRRFLAIVLCAMVAACTLPQSQRSSITFDSRDFTFLGELLRNTPVPSRQVSGKLMLPATGQKSRPPYPALVFLTSTQSVDTESGYFAQAIQDMGIAVFIVNSFGQDGQAAKAEGSDRTADASLLADAYAALKVLSTNPLIDRQRIGLIGFDKGATPALYAAMKRLKDPLADSQDTFALHIAYFPWCGLRIQRPRTTGVPVLIVTGADDPATSASLCKDLTSEIRLADPEAYIDLVTYPKKEAIADNPLKSMIPLKTTSRDANSPKQASPGCLFREMKENIFVDEYSGVTINKNSLAMAASICSAKRKITARDFVTVDQALRKTKALLYAIFLDR